MLRELATKLEDIGLSDKESKVYLALLERGSATADEAAKATKLNRSTTYVIIKQLIDKGLVSQFKDGKKTKFNAESPLNLNRLLTAQEEQVAERKASAVTTIPELVTIFSSTGARPIVRYFEGKEGLVSLREELLKTKDKQYFAAASIDSMNDLFTEKELLQFSKRRAENGIAMHLIYSKKTGDDLVAVGNQQLLRVDESAFPFSADVYIYDNKVSFASTSERVGGVIIESQSISDTMRSLFKVIWSTAR